MTRNVIYHVLLNQGYRNRARLITFAATHSEW